MEISHNSNLLEVLKASEQLKEQVEVDCSAVLQHHSEVEASVVEHQQDLEHLDSNKTLKHPCLEAVQINLQLLAAPLNLEDYLDNQHQQQEDSGPQQALAASELVEETLQ